MNEPNEEQLHPVAQIAVLRERLAQMQKALDTMSRNMWGVLLALAGMLGKFVLDNIEIGGTTPADAPVSMIGFLAELIRGIG